MGFSEGLYVLGAFQRFSKGHMVPKSTQVFSGSHRSSQVLQRSLTFAQVRCGSLRFTQFRKDLPRFPGFVLEDSIRFAKSCFGSPKIVDVRQGSLAFVRCAKVRWGSLRFAHVCCGLLRIAKVR